MITVSTSPALLSHLQSFVVDGGTVADLLFEGGRLSYPHRRELEFELSFVEPYVLELEARTIEGLPTQVSAAIRLLAREATSRLSSSDPTLALLWEAHEAYSRPPGEGPSLDRLIAALVMVQWANHNVDICDQDTLEAAFVLVRGLHMVGFPPTAASIEELCDGAVPAAVGLGLVEL